MKRWEWGSEEDERKRVQRRTESYQPRVFSASNHVEAGLTLFRVGHTQRQAGQLHWGRGGGWRAEQEVQEEAVRERNQTVRRLKSRGSHSCDWTIHWGFKLNYKSFLLIHFLFLPVVESNNLKMKLSICEKFLKMYLFSRNQWAESHRQEVGQFWETD